MTYTVLHRKKSPAQKYITMGNINIPKKISAKSEFHVPTFCMLLAVLLRGIYNLGILGLYFSNFLL